MYRVVKPTMNPPYDIVMTASQASLDLFDTGEGLNQCIEMEGHQPVYGGGFIKETPVVYDASESDATNSDVGEQRQHGTEKKSVIQRLTRKLIRLRTERWHKRHHCQQKGQTDALGQSENPEPMISSQNIDPFLKMSSSSSDMDLQSMEKGLKAMEPVKRLKRLRRPSTIVPDIRLGSRLEAGMTPSNQEAFKRLVLATSFRMQSLDRKGRVQPMPKGQRSFHGLEDYSPHLVPPPTERFIGPVRVPRILLSVHYRGKGLLRRSTRSFKATNCRYYDKIETYQTIGSHAERFAQSASSEPSDYVADFDYWCPTSEYEEAERKRVLRRAKDHAEAIEAAEKAMKEAAMRESNKPDVNDPTGVSRGNPPEDPYPLDDFPFSKESFVRQVLEDDDRSDDSFCSSDSEQGNGPFKRRRMSPTSHNESVPIEAQEARETQKLQEPRQLREPQQLQETQEPRERQDAVANIPVVYSYTPAPEHLEERQRKERIDEEIQEVEVDEEQKSHPLFDKLLSTVLENPASVLRFPDMKKGVPLTAESGLLNSSSSDGEIVEDEVGKQENNEVSGYELEQSTSIAFYERRGSTNSKAQTPWHGETVRKRKRGQLQSSSHEDPRQKEGARKTDQSWSKSMGWGLMRRIGFTGQLGRNNNGISKPIENRRKSFGGSGGVGNRPVPPASQDDDNSNDSKIKSSAHIDAPQK